MDPQTCFVEMLEALKDGNSEDAIIRAESLWGWLTRGGFGPKTDAPDGTVWEISDTESAAVYVFVSYRGCVHTKGRGRRWRAA